MAEINNKNNIAFVQNEKIPMSKFLWDMYVIGIHQVDAENKAFKSESISAYERDRFIARKIVIEYEHSDELKQKFDHYVFPERILNEFTFTDVDEDEETINYESIQALLENIEAVVKEE
ncbi:ABC-three component system middle component 1 [Bacillus sp. 2205SS5-2]|uniref:ABC-three component system middle component 1 n=1 Tax=Bacillus sp. 2205SS5-2 TaxID=3109031 RepID=UPI003003B566